MQLESLYREIILDHYRHPHHAGLREPYDAEVHHHNPTCGDEVRLRVRVCDGRLEDVSYEAVGCSISQASASVMTDLVIGESLDDAGRVAAEFHRLMTSRGDLEADEDVLQDAVAFEGVARYPARVKCALLPWLAWRDAVVQATGREAVTEGALSE